MALQHCNFRTQALSVFRSQKWRKIQTGFRVAFWLLKERTFKSKSYYGVILTLCETKTFQACVIINTKQKRNLDWDIFRLISFLCFFLSYFSGLLFWSCWLWQMHCGCIGVVQEDAFTEFPAFATQGLKYLLMKKWTNFDRRINFFDKAVFSVVLIWHCSPSL